MEPIIIEPSGYARSFQPDKYCRKICRYFDAVALNVRTLKNVVDPFYTRHLDIRLLQAKVRISEVSWSRKQGILRKHIALVSQELEGEEAVREALQIIRPRMAFAPREESINWLCELKKSVIYFVFDPEMESFRRIQPEDGRRQKDSLAKATLRSWFG